MNLPNLADTFLLEADDLLSEIETVALTLTQNPADKEPVNRVFRAFHTIKGSGSMFGFDQVASFTHHIENLLDQVREGQVPVNEQLATLVLAAADHIRILLAAKQGGKQPDLGMEALLLESVRQITNSHETPAPAVQAAHIAAAATLPVWQIRFRPEPSLLSNGGSPVLLFRDLSSLGACTIHGKTDSLPPIDEIDPEVCYVWWTIQLVGNCTESEIRDVFLFADGGELLIKQVEEETAPPEPVELEAAPAIPPPLHEASATPTAPAEAASSATQPIAKEATVRVPAERLDRLVNLVGELVMNQSRLARAAAPFQSSELAAPVEEIDRLISELRDDVLQIRMMAIGSIFGRFRRLVRDLSMQLGKEIDLVTEGEETELDKSILDQLGDPLVHLLRNSIDHGIEAASVREAKGKPRRGTIRLIATHRGSDVVVSIQDDGAGLNRDAIRAKAISKQLISPDANLSDKEIYNLILLPGFSTAQTITSVSGRGVGMDVVKRQIDALRGSLVISSEPGKGTCMSLTLPLTLAIIEGLLVEAGGSQYIIPMASVLENVELKQSERLLNNGRNIVAVRGELIPYIDLRDVFHLEGTAPSISKIVIVRYEDQRVGLAVDRVMGTHQTVIQAMGRFFKNIGVVSGSTVMGDGRVSLILDLAGIVQFANNRSRDQIAA